MIDIDGNPYMTSWPDTFFQLYVLMTSANFPDVMYAACRFDALQLSGDCALQGGQAPR